MEAAGIEPAQRFGRQELVPSGVSAVAQPTAVRVSNPLFAPLFGPIPVGGKSKD
jgi:hypothetical protein